MKNANKVLKNLFFQNSAKDIITHFNIAVDVKSWADNNYALFHLW